MEKLLNEIKKEVEKYSNTVTLEIIEVECVGQKMIRITDTKGIFLPCAILDKCSVSSYTHENKTVILILRN